MTQKQIYDRINDRKICPKTGRLRKDVCFHIYKIKEGDTVISYGLFCVVDGVKEKMPLLASTNPLDLKDAYVYAIRKYV